MRGFVLPAFAIALLALAAMAQSEAPAMRQGSSTQVTGPDLHHDSSSHVVGVVHREIADSSPVASATLRSVQNPVKAGSDIKIHFVLENRSDHGIKYFGDLLEVDVRDQYGKLPPETTLGCDRHFFSPCHSEGPGGDVHVSPPQGIIPSHGKLEYDDFLNGQYNLVLGTYTVVGYVCAVKEGPECFKTSMITITVE